jgi:microcystin degradation protein MlrC
MDYAWKTREFVSVRHASIADAVAKARSGQEGADKPLVLADVTDNPGSGHYGDTTNLLRAMIAADLQNAAFHAIFDPEAVQEAIRIGAGNKGRILLGGRHDPEAGGGPLELDAEIVSLTGGRFQCHGPMGGGVWRSYGPSALLRAGGVAIAVISRNGQANDLAQLISLGVDPLHCATIAVKSNHHFRAAFEPIAREVVTVNGGGLGAAILSRMDYRHVRRPIWPLDEIQA